MLQLLLMVSLSAAPAPLVEVNTLKQARVEYELGDRAAKELSQATGLALSPLLGTAVLGAWRYVTTAPDAPRPVSAHPLFFGPLLLLIALLALPRSSLVPLPVIKRFAKALAVFESKASAFIFIPLQTLTFTSDATQREVGAAVLRAALPTAWADSGASTEGPVTAFIGSVTLTLISALIWLLGHTVRVLCLVSPFSVIDLALRSVKTSAVLLLLATWAVSPTAALGLCLVYFAVAALLAGWSFRLMVFGAVFCTDLLRLTGRRAPPEPALVFSSSLPGVAARTLGRLRREGEALVFEWRPWLVFAKRRVTVVGASAVEKGLLHPVVVDAERRVVVRCAPRHRAQSEAIGAALHLPVLEQPLVRGFVAMKAWFADQLGRVRRPRPA